MILVDTNIWIDLVRSDPVWLDWSVRQLKQAREQGPLAINPVIYAELAALYDDHAQLRAFLRSLKVKNQALSDTTAYLAGQAFWAYRQRKGTKTGVLPDFFIGAQAQAEGWALLTRDAARYRTYFPAVALICPDTTG
jgi:predicted nucleic acid-binding protein